MTRRNPRSYTYRVPMDDSRAMRKINRLQSLNDDYHVAKVSRKRVPNGKAVRHWGFVFYESRERFDYDRNEMVGGPIPGFHNYRYSLEWERTPETELLEMRNANGGGTKIVGEKYIGTSDPRLPDYVPVDTVVPWTPTEIKAMFDGKKVPNRVDYSHDPPEMEPEDARRRYRRIIDQAADDGLEQCRELLAEQERACPHDHVVETGEEYGVAAYCEDCGRDWDGFDYEREQADGTLTVVGRCE